MTKTSSSLNQLHVIYESKEGKIPSNWPFPTEEKYCQFLPLNSISPKQEAIDLIHDAMKQFGITVEEIEHFKKTLKDRSKHAHKDVIKDILITMKDERIVFNDLK